MKISEYSVRRPITVTMVTVSILVLGYISLGRLPLTLLPEFESSNLQVFVSYPSSAPEEVQRNITRPLEAYLSTLNGLVSISSNSSNSGARIRLEFQEGMDMDLASLEVRDKIDQARNELPGDIERVSIRRWQTTDMPVFRFAIGWEGERDELYRVTEDVIRRRIERIDGVASFDVRGLEARQIIVDLDERRLQAHGIDVFQLGQSLRANNVNVSGGYVLEGDKKYSLRTVGELLSADDIKRIPLQRGRLTIGDVADVRFDFPERTDYSRLNGQEAISGSVYKASTANVVSVCSAIAEELDKIQHLPELEGKLAIRVFQNQAEPILSTLNDLKTAGIWGGLLAMIVLFLFLMKFRSTLIISLAIPVSVVFTCAFLYLLRVFGGSDISLNTVSMMGLMVAVGMLVDNSVVVLENIYRFKQDKGMSAMEAAIKGSQEVGIAVLASTATTVVVFAAFIFLPNSVSGRWTRDFGITVAVSLIASLIVALTLIPMVSSRIFTGAEKPKQRVIVFLTDFYGRFMNRMLRWRFVALIIMAGLGYSSWVLFGSIEREFFPSVAEREIRFDVLMERTYSADEMLEMFKNLEKLLLDRSEELQIVALSSGFDTRSTRRGQFRGNLNLFLKDEGELVPTVDLRNKVQALFPQLPGVEFRPGRMRRYGGGGEMGISLELRGDDPAILSLYADEIKARLSEIPGISAVQTTLDSGDDEILLAVDRQRIEALGISSLSVARSVSSALGSRATTRLKGDSGEIDVIVQMTGGNQIRLDQLLNMNIENREGTFVPLHSVVSYRYQKGPVSIERENRKAVVDVTADTSGGGSFFASQQAREALEGIVLPPGYEWEMGQDWRRARQGEQESFFAILLALALMYIIMAALFENFLHPLTILFTVPFSIIGVALMFYMTGTSLSQTAYLGILILFGIVVNNGIILVDHINNLRRSGMPRHEAVVQAGKDRHRPILMTALTSLIGLLPLSLPYLMPSYFEAAGGRAGMWAPVSIAVLGGLTTSTFLTLVVLPPVYTYMDDLSRILAWFFVRVANPIRFLRGELGRSEAGSR